MSQIDIEGAVAEAIRTRVPALTATATAHQGPTQPTYPYAVAKPVTETPQYSSGGRVCVGDLIQVSVFSRSAAEANDLAKAIDREVSDQPLVLSEDYVTKIWLEQKIIMDPVKGPQGSDVHQRVLTFRCVRRKVRVR